MRNWWMILLACCLPCKLAHAQEPDPGYGLLAYKSDPAPYATGAGPSGGWGIGAASANPASLMFGPQSTMTAAPLLGPVLFAGGTRLTRHLRLGASVDYVPEFDRNSSLQSLAPSGRYAGSARRGDLLVRLHIAFGVADRAALGLTLKHLSSTGRSDYLDLLAADLGLRFDAVWPAASLIVDHGRMLPSSRVRWPAGFSFGVSGLNVPIAQRGARAGDMEVPTWWSAGVTYRAIVSRPICLSLGGTLFYWPNVSRSPDPYSWEPKWSDGAYSVGMGLEINELLEAGLAIYGPGRLNPVYYGGDYFGEWYHSPRFEQDNLNLEIYGGIGPPWLRILIGGGMYGKLGDTESDGRLWIRSQFPFGEGAKVGSTFFD